MTLCECGCGSPAPIAARTSTKHGRVSGQPCRFIAGHNWRREPTPGTFVYKQVYAPETRNEIRQQHAVIAERALGKALPRGAEVHHVDENTLNNAPSNLVICQDKAYHKLLHCRAHVVRAGGNPNIHKMCNGCNAPRPFAAFNRSLENKAYGLFSRCRDCQRESFAAWYRKQATA